MRNGAIVVCGGGSARMGCDKAMLPFGPGEVMLQRVVRLLAEVVPAENMVIVAAREQQLPELPEELHVARDRHADCGPLEGLATGMAALPPRVDAAFACGCDVPLLVPALVEQMFCLLGQSHAALPVDAVLPVDELRSYPLAAVYRTSLLPQLRQRLDNGVRAMQSLADLDGAAHIPTATLKEFDPQLATFATCNTRTDYEAALVRCGFHA